MIDNPYTDYRLPGEIEWDDVQGLLAVGFKKYSASCLFYITFNDVESNKIKDWFRPLLNKVANASQKTSHNASHNANNDYLYNVALSAGGLEKLGLGAESLKRFPMEFVQGMASSRAACVLGDVGASAPDRWRWGGTAGSPDMVLLAYAKPGTDWQAHEDELKQSLGAIGTIDRLETYYSTHEHFGFRDGLSNPVIRGAQVKSRPEAIGPGGLTAPGEFIFGYSDERGLQTNSPAIPVAADPDDLLPFAHNDLDPNGRYKDLGRNGSFMVLRQLQQDVTAFDQFINDNASSPDDQDLLRAKLVGRWQDGTPITVSPDRPDPALAQVNNFGYADHADGAGDRCPVGAHIRRTNPRDSINSSRQTSLDIVQRHSILRRGRLYSETVDRAKNEALGPAAERTGKKGLLFICFNLALSRQFEHIQQTWVNNRKFGMRGETDPLIGSRAEGDGFTVPKLPIQDKYSGLTDFVTVKGGGYFFYPGLKALRVLAG